MPSPCRVCLIVLWLALLTAVSGAESFSGPYLSEILSINSSGLKDEDGERSPWIEIHNGSSAPVYLTGWYLTDTTNALTKWKVPPMGVLPDKDIVVFASGKNRTNDLRRPHTNFRLSATNSYVALVNPATNIVSELRYAEAKPDTSFGSVRGEPAWRGRFARPTPGKPNAALGSGFAPSVQFSALTRTFIQTQVVTLSAAAPATVHYTLDGSIPTTNSPAYAAPFILTNTAHLRARAFKPGSLPGPLSSGGYFKLHTNALNFTSTLPIIVLETFGKDLPAARHGTFAYLSLFEPSNGVTSLTNAPSLSTRTGFRVRGSTSSGLPQPPFALHLLDEFNEERALSLCGLPADSDWVLYAPNMFDPVLIHNPFIHQLSRDMGHYSPRTRFVEVFFARTPGRLQEAQYHGLYVLEEKIKIGKHRVAIERAGADDLNPPEVTGGYLLKFDRLGPNEAGLSGGGASMVFADPNEPALDLPQRTAQKVYLKKFFNDFGDALNGTNWLAPYTGGPPPPRPTNGVYAGYRAYFDVSNAIDFHVLEVLSGNVDALVLSTYLYKPRNGRITYGPHWDFDRALGSTDGRDANPRQWNTGPFFGGAWWPRLFSDPDFWQAWIDRWQELRLNLFSLTNLYALTDRFVAEVAEAQPREYKRWNFQPRGGSFQSEVSMMKVWLSNRVDFIDSELVALPSISVTNGTMTFVVPTNCTVRFTLDGTDPRDAGGAAKSNAVTYSTPIPLASATRLVARAHNPAKKQNGGPPISSPWSGPVLFPHAQATARSGRVP